MKAATRYTVQEDTDHLRKLLCERVNKLNLDQLQRLERYMPVIEEGSRKADPLPAPKK